LSRVIDGLFGANIATAQAALSDITDDNTRTQGLGLTGAAFGLGFIFGPVISLLALQIGNGALALPALSAAGYSFISILLTLFVFKETLPPEKRGNSSGRRSVNPFLIMRYLLNPTIGVLLVLMFAQQLIFFGFESLLGLFTLSRLGMMGGANAYIFIVIGLTLVVVQVRFIGKWSRKYGEHRLVQLALGLLAIGLIMIAFTPQQPHLFYIKRNVEYDLQEQVVNSTEAIIGDLNVVLPEDDKRSIWGVLWVFMMVIPLAVGAGLIRPNLNSIMTRRVGKQEYGSILGVSASFVSAANAAAPLLGGYVFQHYGSTVPFLLGGLLMGGLALSSLILVKPLRT
jgi:MFS family permease